jgi:CO/xanthine dehydrogenase FAD-binding subunit
MSTEFTKVASVEELLERLAEPGARILCGGTDLLVKMRGGLVLPSRLLDVSDLPELRGLSEKDGAIEIGAAVPFSEILANEVVRDRLPILALVLSKLGSVQIRNRGTLGGNLVNASPAADSAIALLLLDARLSLTSARGDRSLALEEFLLGPGKTALGPGEFVRSIQVPIPDPPLAPSFRKVGRRKALTIAIASVGALTAAKNGVFEEVRLAAGSVAPTPLRLRKVEEIVRGKRLTPDLVAQARALTAQSVSPIDDVRSSAAYRREVTADLVARLLEESLHA